MTDDAQWSRRGTRMQGVHTILSLPQWYLNARLADLLENGSDTGDGSLREVRLALKPGGPLWLKGTVSELSVVAHQPGEVGRVGFTVAFDSGVLDYYDLASVPPEQMSCDIAGLRVSFLVDLARAGVHPDDFATLPDVVRERAEKLPGAFTIERLFMDLENADLAQYNRADTVFPPGMPPSAIAAFATYLATYLRAVSARDGHILGYAVTVPEWEDPTPSFPPRSIDYVTNEYRAAVPSADDRDLDSVLYLMMTGRAALPTNLTPWWGNFAQPSDGRGDTHYGTIAMARELFVDGFLLPRVAPLLCGHVEVRDNSKGLDLLQTPAVGSFTRTPTGGHWRVGPVTAKSHKSHPVSNDDMAYTFAWDVELEIVPGTNRIWIRRTVDFDISYTHWYGGEGHALSTSCHIWYRVPLTVTITMLGAVDGRLQVDVTSETTSPPSPTELSDIPFDWYSTRYTGDASILTDVQKHMETASDSAVAVAMSQALPRDIGATLTQELNVAPFVFPGGAQLSMVDPVFNDHGDLLFGVSQKS